MSDLSSLERTILQEAVQESSPAGLLEPVVEEEQQQAELRTSHAAPIDGDDDSACVPQGAIPCSDRKHVRYLTNVQQLEQRLAASSWKDAAVALTLCREYNSAAMRVLDSGGLDLAFQLLEKAQVLCEPGGLLSSTPRQQRTLHAATLNNLAVYHRHRAQPSQALSLLQHALAIEQSPPSNASVAGDAADELGEQDAGAADNPAATLINICTVLSGMGRHAEGLQHAREAAASLCATYGIHREELEAWCSSRALSADAQLPRLSSGRPGSTSHRSGSGGGAWLQWPSDGGASTASKSSLGSAHSRSTAVTGTSAASRSSADEVAMARVGSALKFAPPSQCSALAMAYYNEAVELEHLEDDSSALQSYALAAALTVKMFGRGSNLALAFTKSLQAFKMKLKSGRRRPSKSAATSVDASAPPRPSPQSTGSSTHLPAAATSAGNGASTTGGQGVAIPGTQRQAGHQHRSSTLPQLHPRSGAPQLIAPLAANKHNPYIAGSSLHGSRRTAQAYSRDGVNGRHTMPRPDTANEQAFQAYAPQAGKRPGTSTAGPMAQSIVPSQATTGLDLLFEARRMQLQALKGSLGKAHS